MYAPYRRKYVWKIRRGITKRGKKNPHCSKPDSTEERGLLTGGEEKEYIPGSMGGEKSPANEGQEQKVLRSDMKGGRVEKIMKERALEIEETPNSSSSNTDSNWSSWRIKERGKCLSKLY